MQYYIFNKYGFGLVEILVATTILSFGLMAIASLQLLSMQSTKEAEQQTTATMIAEDMIARMMANRSEINTYITPPESPTANICVPATGAGCTKNALANLDISQIRARLRNELNTGTIIVTEVDALDSIYNVNVSWQSRDNNTRAVATRNINIRTQIP